MQIGVLALQGAFREHIHMLQRMGMAAHEVRLPAQLAQTDGLIMPGGESTTMGKLAREYGLLDAIRAMAQAGKPIWGTCAGMILLAKDIGAEPPHLGLMDVRVQRNAFGRQVDSFEMELLVPALAELGDARPFHAIFIRAPLIQSVGQHVEALARLPNGTVVAARQDNLMATSFHPELTRDARFHRFFVERLGR
jgi:5'-phosphate synthase pdxT subunit